jgi:WD40 repeat protein
MGFRHHPGVQILNGQSDAIEVRLPLPGGQTLAWSPDGRWLVASGATHVLWDTQSWTVNTLPQIAPCAPPAGAAAFSPSLPGQATGFLALASAGNRVVLVELASRTIVATLEAPEGRVLYQLSFSPDLRWLLAASAQGEIQAWDIAHLRSLLH